MLGVSIHPRLFRRGNAAVVAARRVRGPVSIHPRLFRRGNRSGSSPRCEMASFQSTPAFSGEGTPPPHRCCWWIARFNPPPPFQARELDKPVAREILPAFQSTPAFSGEGTLIRRHDISPHLFQSTPAFSGEGTPLRQANDNRKVIRAVARTRLQLNSYAVNTPFPIK